MGRRGPAPRPAAVQELHGARRSRIHLEPVPLAVGLQPPAWLTPEAAEVWASTEPELEAMGLSHRADSTAFAAYCTAAALFARLSAELPSTAGELQRWRMAAGEFRQWCREFGLSPAARQGIGAPPARAEPARLLD